MLKIEQEVKIKTNEIVLGNPLYRVGEDSVAVTIPKSMVKKLNLEPGQNFMWLDTDKGIMLVPFDKLFRPDAIREVLSFLKLYAYTKEDLELLLRDDEHVGDH